MKILMVCLGNICRSPLAEGILEKKNENSDVTVESAGTSAYHTGEPADTRTIEIAKKNNIDLSKHRARQFIKSDFNRFDIIYTMDIDNYNNIISLANNKEEKIKVRMILDELNPNNTLSVPDPYYQDNNGFQKVYDILEEVCTKIISQIE